METLQITPLIYKQKVTERHDLTTEQKVCLIQIFNLTYQGKYCHTSYLQQCTGLSWKQVNWTLNGLKLRGAITQGPREKTWKTKLN